MRPQVLGGQDAQISALSLNADTQSGGAACSWNRYVPVVIPPVHQAVTLQRWHPSCREPDRGSEKENKAVVLPFMQTLGAHQYVAAAHGTALWVRRWHSACHHGSFPSDPLSAVLPRCFKTQVVCEGKVGI